MATRQSPKPARHTCSCGKQFETTNRLVEHARSEHGLRVL
jgi:predicted small metal-binding protein